MSGNEVDLKKRQQRELLLIQKYLDIVKEAGFGEVIIKVQDSNVVHIGHTAQKEMRLK